MTLVRKPFRDHEIFDAMARHLDVQYLYREREIGKQAGIREQSSHLRCWAELPRELLQELRGSTLALDREAIAAGH